MATAIIQLPPDSTGKMIAARSYTEGSNTVYAQAGYLTTDTAGGNPAAVQNTAINGTEYGLVVRPMDSNQMTYHLYQSPRVTTAAATDFFDLFNASGSGYRVRVLGIYPVIQVTAANAIIPSFQFSVIRTSAVGTGGTTATFEGAASPTTALVNITRADSTDVTLPAQITSRSLPTGGATGAAFLFDVWTLTEETNAATYLLQTINWLPTSPAIKEPILNQGQGIKIRQVTATASTGANFGWLVPFSLIV